MTDMAHLAIGLTLGLTLGVLLMFVCVGAGVLLVRDAMAVLGRE